MRVLACLRSVQRAPPFYISREARTWPFESPTGGPNDVVQNNILYRHYGVVGDRDLISGFPCFVRGNLPSGIAMPCLVETAPGRSLRRSLP